jgi:hypothetical protein
MSMFVRFGRIQAEPVRVVRPGGRDRSGLYAPAMNAAPWATGAENKFRQVARTTENPTTKLLAEGLSALAEAVRQLDHDVEAVRKLVQN